MLTPYQTFKQTKQRHRQSTDALQTQWLVTVLGSLESPVDRVKNSANSEELGRQVGAHTHTVFHNRISIFQLIGMGGTGQVTALILGIILGVLMRPVDGRFLRFEPGYEYQYKFHSDAQVHDVDTFTVAVRVSIFRASVE